MTRSKQRLEHNIGVVTEGIWLMTTTLLAVLAAVGLIIALILSWLLTLVGLPGNWIMVFIVAGYAWLVPDPWRSDVGWNWIVALVVLAAIGEMLEFMAGSVGTQRAGGSRRAALYALGGSMLGGLAGAFVALPIPLVGPLLGALLFSGVGAAVGAIWGELSSGGDPDRSWQVGQGAFWGRLLGTGAKTLVGCAMLATTIAALLV